MIYYSAKWGIFWFPLFGLKPSKKMGIIACRKGALGDFQMFFFSAVEYRQLRKCFKHERYEQNSSRLSQRRRQYKTGRCFQVSGSEIVCIKQMGVALIRPGKTNCFSYFRLSQERLCWCLRSSKKSRISGIVHFMLDSFFLGYILKEEKKTRRGPSLLSLKTRCSS